MRKVEMKWLKPIFKFMNVHECQPDNKTTQNRVQNYIFAWKDVQIKLLVLGEFSN